MLELTGAIPLSEIANAITYVKDRPGHDRRYAIDCSKLKSELCWQNTHDFEDGLQRTVQWYVENKVWIDSIQSGEYRKWIETNYGQR